jgi:integrase
MISGIVLPTWQFDAFEAVSQLLVRHESLFRIVRATHTIEIRRKHDLVIPLADGTPWPPDRFTDEYIAFTRRVTAREIRFHDLRHTHASELLRRGIPLKTVSQRLGHANPTVTLDIYAHVMSGDDEKAAKTTDDIYKKRSMKKGKKRAK